MGGQPRIAHLRCGMQLFLFFFFLRPISGYYRRTGWLKQENKSEMKEDIRKHTHPGTMAGKSWGTRVIKAVMIPQFRIEI